MAEAPLGKLARLIGGAALSYGPLGHQVLGQLLTLNAKEVEVAAATALVVASSRQPNAGLYAAIRILGPAVAVHLITRRELDRLERAAAQLDQKATRLSQLEAALAAASDGGPR